MVMQRFHSLLLEVWREACRHIELAESVSTLQALLQQKMPAHRLIVRRFDRRQHTLDTVSAQQDASPLPADFGKTTLNPAQSRKLAIWCASGGIVHHRPGKDKLPGHLSPVVPGLKGELLIGPLVSEHQNLGLLIIEAIPPHLLSADHLAIAELLLEPLSTALENDHRLRELQTLREAAEADKRTLLARLGRDQLQDAVVGANRGLRPVMERVELVSPSSVPVLLLGETGSGKEVIARAIHTKSTRHAGPFIRVNCGAIPPELIDSELFGHEKGSFTGASATRKGWFERAHEGTLFLDEIGELPLAAQVRMLRVLQEGTFERVGGEKAISADVRVIAATHRDLAAMVQNHTFREDLWYRLAVFPIVIPPLREHRDDIPELVHHFAQRAAKRFGLAYHPPRDSDLALLQAYDWPGNVRELASVIDRAAILGGGRGLEVARALGGPIASTAPKSAPAEAASPLPVQAAALNSLTAAVPVPTEASQPSGVDALSDAMRRHIEAALRKTRGKIEGPRGAAALLSINPHTLRSRMRKLGLDWSQFREE